MPLSYRQPFPPTPAGHNPYNKVQLFTETVLHCRTGRLSCTAHILRTATACRRTSQLFSGNCVYRPAIPDSIISPIIVRRQPGEKFIYGSRRSVFRAKRKLHLQLFHRIISRRKKSRTNGRRHAIAVIRPAQQIMIPVIADIAL